MSNMAVTIRGARTDEDGATADIEATVSEPEQLGENAGWSCTVRCPGLFPDEMIRGASAAQALHLARLFLLDALEHNGVRVDESDKRTH